MTFQSVTDLWWLIPLGFVLGVFGTLIGAGGGFVLVPLLLLLYPRENPDLITAVSLSVVFANALSGSLAYGAMKRIDYKSGTMFSLAAIPGAVLGALRHVLCAENPFRRDLRSTDDYGIAVFADPSDSSRC
jgi:uncharacterized membrane protein YfcA